MLLRHFSVLRILSRPAAIARSPCVQPRSPSTLWLTFQKESYLIQCLFIKMLMPEVSQQDFNFNKGILFDWSLRSNAEILFSGQQQNPFDNPMQIQVYSTHTHPSAGAPPSGLDAKLPLRIPGHPQRGFLLWPSRLTTTGTIPPIRRWPCPKFCIIYTHSHFLSTHFMSGSCKTLGMEYE